MDTIPRESSSNYVPYGGIILAVIAIILAAVALAKLSKTNAELRTLNASLNTQLERAERIDALENEVRTAAAKADRAAAAAQSGVSRSDMSGFADNINSEFGKIALALETVQADVANLKSGPRSTAASSSSSGGSSASSQPPVAGPGEYVVKGGDIGTKIAAAHGVSLADLMAVNPGVNWNRLAVGQKLKIPQR